MALTPIPPWLDVGPSTFLGAAKAGAATGQAAADALNQYNIHQQQIAAESANAANQVAAARAKAQSEHELALAGQALAQEKQRAENQLGWAHVAIAQNQQGLLNDYRTRENDIREQAIKQREAAAALRNNYLHIGDQLVAPKLGPDGKPVIGPDGKIQFDVLHDAGAGRINQIDRMDYQAALKDKNQAAVALAARGLSKENEAMWRAQMDAADKTLKSIRSRYPGSISDMSSGADLLQNFSVPDALSLGSGMGPSWNTPIPDIGAGDLTAPSMPGTAIDLGLPDQTTPEVRVLNIRPKQ